MLRISKLLILIIACLFIVACGKQQQPVQKQDSIAIVDVDQAITGHALYKEYENTAQIIKKLEEMKSRQQLLAQKQMSSFDQLVSKGLENREKFDQALLVTKMTELETLAKMELLEVQQVVKKELNPSFDKREQAIRDDYKIPIFNIRANLSIVRLKPEEKERLAAELEALEVEQAKRLQALDQEKMKIVRERTKDQEAAIKKRLEESSLGIYQQMFAGSNQQATNMNQKMNKLADELQKTLFNMQQEIDNQKNKQDVLYQKIYQDLESAAAKLAQEHGYGIVMRNVKVNVTAVDITQDIKAELAKYSNK